MLPPDPNPDVADFVATRALGIEPIMALFFGERIAMGQWPMTAGQKRRMEEALCQQNRGGT